MLTGTNHTDADHIQEFRNRWQFVNGVTGRPNGITFANNSGRWFDAGDDRLWLPTGSESIDYMFLSDHNRSTIPFNTERIGANKRMINGSMRSYHTADKLTTTVSWDDLPSRAFSTLGGYSEWTSNSSADCAKFTMDGGAGGVELLKWWQEHHGSFWVYFSIDAVPFTLSNTTVFQGYSKVYEMHISDFDYDIKKRSGGWSSGGTNPVMYYMDLWDVSMTLEEI